MAEVWKVTGNDAHPDKGNDNDICGPTGTTHELSGKVPLNPQ